MNITRFDEIEFSVLEICINGLGYYPYHTEYGKRARLMMDEGIIKDIPVEVWPKCGYGSTFEDGALTEYGKEYAKEFYNIVRSTHGHVWETNNQDDPDDQSDYGKKINRFAYSYGYHNGYRCAKCGFEFCVHCNSEFEVTQCSEK